jgi:putative transcriptional regulator
LGEVSVSGKKCAVCGTFATRRQKNVVILLKMKNYVREYREYYGVSLRWLARKVGCGASTLSAVERGERVPGVYLALRIAKALGTSVSDLWGKE